MPQTNYALHLKGYVGGADFDRNYVDYVLAKCKDKPVDVLIDSLGGSVATALSNASAFRNHGNVNAHFVGMNASAATIASLGARHISIDANAMYLVHKCSSEIFEWRSLNADQFAQLIAECEKTKEDLDKLDLNIASMYSGKCKKKTCELLDLMAKGGWLSAKEALEWGFVDEVTDLPEEAAPRLTEAVASEMAAAGMPIPNIPITDKDSALNRFLAAIASLFKSSNKTETNMEQESQAQTQAQNSTQANDRIADLESQLAQRETTIGELQQQIASLTQQVADLNAAPGDSSRQVLDDAKNATLTDDPRTEYVNDLNEARKVLAEISGIKL